MDNPGEFGSAITWCIRVTKILIKVALEGTFDSCKIRPSKKKYWQQQSPYFFWKNPLRKNIYVVFRAFFSKERRRSSSSVSPQKIIQFPPPWIPNSGRRPWFVPDGTAEAGGGVRGVWPRTEQDSGQEGGRGHTQVARWGIGKRAMCFFLFAWPSY